MMHVIGKGFIQPHPHQALGGLHRQRGPEIVFMRSGALSVMAAMWSATS
jgi:hypothetical protein